MDRRQERLPQPEVRILCPSCGDIFPGIHGQKAATCHACGLQFDPMHGNAKGTKATCHNCNRTFTILDAVSPAGKRPDFRLYGKLVLTRQGIKEYLPATAEDMAAYRDCSALLQHAIERGEIRLPALSLESGYNTRQAMGYGFAAWRDFFNDRQLLGLGWLQAVIAQVADPPARAALATLFSGALEFHNLFASYKGEGTGAVRHMFSHHILKPERVPIEANIWGTPKSSGSFSNLFRSRLLRAIEYRQAPTEVNGTASAKGRICSPAFTGKIEAEWPRDGELKDRAVYLSCGDSAATGLPDRCVDLIVTDPPFFDNVHYSELADFFHAWRRSADESVEIEATTRNSAEVQDADSGRFASKLGGVLRECRRVLKDDGVLIFTYHHSRGEGWRALADAVLGAGFTVVNSQPVKAEMAVATPKSQAKEPIQFDIILVCRKTGRAEPLPPSVAQASKSAKAKLQRLRSAGFELSRNDRKVVRFGQLLTALSSPAAVDSILSDVEDDPEEAASPTGISDRKQQTYLFD